MEITRETPINFITFSYQDQKSYLNNCLARMCMDSWKRAFPNLNIINIDITEEIASMNEFSKFFYKNGVKSYTTDPLRLYYINQYDNCVYSDTDVLLTNIDSLLKSMNENNEFIIINTGTFTWNKYKNNQKFIDFFNFYDEFTEAQIGEISKDRWKFSDGYMANLYNISTKIKFISQDIDILGGIYHINVNHFYFYSNKIFIKYYPVLFMFFIKFKFYKLPKIPNNIIYLQNRNFN